MSEGSTRLALLLLAAWMILGPSLACAQDLRPARYCGACHGQIRREWESSAMAHAAKNPVFLAFLSDAKAALGETAAAACVACHAPAAAVTADYKFESSVSQEGVTCNFCHNVSAVEPSGKPASYTFDQTDPNLMRGPYKDADPGTAHKWVYSELHTKSEMCAACHEHASENGTGVPIEVTYSRWKTSEAASEGEQCQDCHMPATKGQAAPGISKKRDVVHGHGFPGPRTAAWLDTVVTMTAKPKGGALELTITNRRAGHTLPGGGGGMRLIRLAVAFYGSTNEAIGTTEVQTYGIRYADAKGATPVPKWLARTVAHQAEIPAQGSATESCPIPPKAKRAEATLTYYSIDPAYVASLQKQKVDLSARGPVTLARATVKLP